MDGHAHRCGARPAQSLTGLVLAADDILRMEDLDGGRRSEWRSSALLIWASSPTKETRTIMALAGQSHASDHRAHTLITAHRVNSDTRQSHGCLPPAVARVCA
jgi:hypothetical protein